MAWTAPMTAVANSVLTAAQWNIHVRDNFLETAPAKATTSGRHFVTTGANTIAERDIPNATVATAQTTTSTTYTDLATSGPAVTVTTGTKALALYAARMWNSVATDSSAMSVAVSSATTIAADDAWVLDATVGSSGLATGHARFKVFTTLTAGSNTFTAKYRVTGNTGTFVDRDLIVIPLN